MTEVSVPASSKVGGVPHSPAVTIPTKGNAAKQQYAKADAFSPVNQYGSFEFHRVLKTGEVNKRSRKTKSWKRFYLVLRPNLLSVYKSRSEEKLLKQLNLGDVTAVALLKDPKGRRTAMFGVFSPSRNFHFQAPNDIEARAWVDIIKREARVDEDEPILFGSPPGPDSRPSHSIEQYIFSGDEGDGNFDHGLSSSPEPMDGQSMPSSSYKTTRDGVRIPALRTPTGTTPSNNSVQQHEFEYSGADQGSFSDFSDAGGPLQVRKSYHAGPSMATERAPSQPRVHQNNADAVTANSASEPVMATNRPAVDRKFSGNSNGATAATAAAAAAAADDERVVYHGYLLCLKSKGGVRQWKRLWTVLRPKSITFYKNEDEYAAQLILPLSAILSAVELDPISKTKSHCMQIIAEDKSYRFAAPSEEAQARWLGALKSQLAKRKEKGKPATSTANEASG